jgi:hypothetical protein
MKMPGHHKITVNVFLEYALKRLLDAEVLWEAFDLGAEMWYGGIEGLQKPDNSKQSDSNL